MRDRETAAKYSPDDYLARLARKRELDAQNDFLMFKYPEDKVPRRPENPEDKVPRRPEKKCKVES